MPHRDVHLKRWHIGAAFLLLTAVFVVGQVQLSCQASRTHELAVRTNRLAVENADHLRQLRELRRRSIRLSKAADYALCAGLNRNRRTVRRTLSSLILAGERRIPKIAYYKEHPDEARDAVADQEAYRKEVVRNLRDVNCRVLPGLAPGQHR